MRAGEWPDDDSPLRHAPHTAEDVLADDWSRPYSREQAAYPGRRSVRRQVLAAGQPHRRRYGDRNLLCACPPVSAYADA